jgi:NAD(P)-dependent dehydrogenase (short-subunit alcohol dehydrogenase family)
MPQPVAFVTGASTGIGFETAKKLASAGFTVYAGARRVELMEQLLAFGVKVVALDVTDEASMSAAVGDVLAAHAATARRPRTRYPVGANARGILLLRHLLPDRAFDAVLWNIHKRFPGRAA